jgi:hypothetical protein
MMKVFLLAIVLLLAIPANSAAHRLDEYLQAARVSLGRDVITLEVDLTPGSNITPAIVPLLDRNGDNTISPGEAKAYAQVVLADLRLELDGRPLALTLRRVEIPSIDEMRDGLGTIQLRADGPIDVLPVGRRELYFRNDHRPAASVYLVNALVPRDPAVVVLSQARDARQRDVHIAYDVGPHWPSQLLWIIFGVGGLSTLVLLRRGGVAREDGHVENRLSAPTD